MFKMELEICSMPRWADRIMGLGELDAYEGLWQYHELETCKQGLVMPGLPHFLTDQHLESSINLGPLLGNKNSYPIDCHRVK